MVGSQIGVLFLDGSKEKPKRNQPPEGPGFCETPIQLEVGPGHEFPRFGLAILGVFLGTQLNRGGLKPIGPIDTSPLASGDLGNSQRITKAAGGPGLICRLRLERLFFGHHVFCVRIRTLHQQVETRDHPPPSVSWWEMSSSCQDADANARNVTQHLLTLLFERGSFAFLLLHPKTDEM